MASVEVACNVIDHKSSRLDTTARRIIIAAEAEILLILMRTIIKRRQMIHPSALPLCAVLVFFSFLGIVKACTTTLAGRATTVDGSVMPHTADGGGG